MLTTVSCTSQYSRPPQSSQGCPLDPAAYSVVAPSLPSTRIMITNTSTRSDLVALEQAEQPSRGSRLLQYKVPGFIRVLLKVEQQKLLLLSFLLDFLSSTMFLLLSKTGRNPAVWPPRVSSDQLPRSHPEHLQLLLLRHYLTAAPGPFCPSATRSILYNIWCLGACAPLVRASHWSSPSSPGTFPGSPPPARTWQLSLSHTGSGCRVQ